MNETELARERERAEVMARLTTAVSKIIEMMPEDFISMSPGMRAALQLRLEGISDLKTVEQVEERVLGYVHFNTLERTPISLARLNRLYGRAAHHAGTSVRTVCEYLSASVPPKLQRFECQKICYVSTHGWNGVRAMLEGMGTVEGSADWHEVLEAWARNVK